MIDIEREHEAEETHTKVTREVPLEIPALARGSGAVTLPPTAQRMLGGRYVVRRELGRGGTANVFLAFDVLLERDVVLKVLSPELARDGRNVERFLLEARTLAEIESTRLVPILDVQHAPGETFLVLPHVAGRTVEQIVASLGPLASNAALQIALDVLVALSALHARGLVHRDIKPANVLVDAHERGLLLDLGAVQDRRRGRITPICFTVGTRSFMSPEQRSSGHVDARSDVYQVGLLLAFMLLGNLSPLDTVDLRRMPRRVRAVVEQALATPSDRFADAADMARAIEAALADPGTVELLTEDVETVSDDDVGDELATAPVLLLENPRPVARGRGWRTPLGVICVAAAALWSLNASLDHSLSASAATVVAEPPSIGVLQVDEPVGLSVYAVASEAVPPAREPELAVARTSRAAAPAIVDEQDEWLRKAFAYERVGARESAIAALRTYLRKNPDGAARARVMFELARLEQ